MCKCNPSMKLAYCGLGECQYPEKLAKLNEIHDKIIVAVFGARNAICFRDGVKTSSIKLIISLHQDLYYQGFSIGYRIPESLFCEADLKGTMMGYPVVFHRTIDHFALPELNIPEIIVTEVLS